MLSKTEARYNAHVCLVKGMHEANREEGTIKHTEYEVEDPISVEWDNGFIEHYSLNDLELI